MEVYKELARQIGWWRKTGSKDAERRVRYIQEFYLPNNTGFEKGTKVVLDESTETKLVFRTAFHVMNDAGRYIGWYDPVIIIVTPSWLRYFDIEAVVSLRPESETKKFIKEAFAIALHQEFDEQRYRKYLGEV